MENRLSLTEYLLARGWKLYRIKYMGEPAIWTPPHLGPPYGNKLYSQPEAYVVEKAVCDKAERAKLQQKEEHND